MQGGFLPIFWDVPKSTMHAVSDIGALVEWLQEHIAFGQDSTENLAVLHNQNHMVHEVGLSAWVTQSKRQVISRSVTSCAGMTAYMVVVAQTKVGFLTGGRGEKFRNLPEEERRTQEEEAYARATVALTRARKMCVIFCPLDMKGLIGAATVMGSLMYGAGHCWNGMVNMHLRHSSLDDCLSDDQFLSLFDHMDVPTGTMAQRRYPPVALIECVADITQTHWRLHLVIVDLWRPWKIHQAQVRSLKISCAGCNLACMRIALPHWRPMLAKLHSIEGALSMDTAWMVLIFPAISCGHGAPEPVRSACWSPRLADMLI